MISTICSGASGRRLRAAFLKVRESMQIGYWTRRSWSSLRLWPERCAPCTQISKARQSRADLVLCKMSPIIAGISDGRSRCKMMRTALLSPDVSFTASRSPFDCSVAINCSSESMCNRARSSLILHGVFDAALLKGVKPRIGAKGRSPMSQQLGSSLRRLSRSVGPQPFLAYTNLPSRW